MLNDQVKTQRLDFSFLSPYQAQKELIVNENINKIDLLLNRGVKSFTKEIAINSLNYGDLLIIPADADNELRDYKGHILLYTDELQYIKPSDGMIFWAQEEKCLIVYTEEKWIDLLGTVNNA